MTETRPEQHLCEAFASLEAMRAGEPAWLAAARKAAIGRFAEIGFPTRRAEAWKYTNTAPIARIPWQPAASARVETGALRGLGVPLDEGPSLVFVNGRFAPDLSAREGIDPRATAASLSELATRGPGRAETLLSDLAPFADHAFALLALAFAPDGLFVHVPAGVELEHPITVLHVSSGADAATTTQALTAVVCERGSRARFQEAHVSLGRGETLACGLSRVVVEDGASLEHVVSEQAGSEAASFRALHADLARDARYAHLSVTVGGRLVRSDLMAALGAEGAECDLHGLYSGCDQRHIDHFTTVEHRRPHTASREHYKGVLAGRSRGIFHGKVVVCPEAQHSDAQQRNDNLLLSERAEIDSKPTLEILNNDVRCSHGSAIGQLDEDALFYLRSRGLAEVDARALLVRGFADQILARLPSERWRQDLIARVLSDVLADREEES